MSILDVLNPVSALVNTVKGLIGSFVADPSKKLELEQQVAAQQAAIESQLIAASQATITAEETGSWLQRSWRPIVAMGIFTIILYSGVFVSLFHLPQINMAGVPDQLWSTFKIMVGGYMGLRTAEKVADGYFKS